MLARTPHLRGRLLAAALSTATLGFFTGAPATAEAAPSALEKIAVVDIQRCILETTQGRAATKELEQAIARSQAKLERAQKVLQQKVADLQAKGAMLSQTVLMQRQQELMRQQQELEQLYQEQSLALQEKEAQLTEKIYRNTATIVEEMAKAEGVQVVLVRTQANVLYANPKLDLTNRVIVAYDKRFK